VRLDDRSADRIAEWSRTNEDTGHAPSARLALITLNQICRYAVRIGQLVENPVAQLERGEKPRPRPLAVRVLGGDELERVVAHCGSYAPLVELLGYTGLRVSEGLGLRWRDIDWCRQLVSVRQQLSRAGVPKTLKSPAARRDVVMAPGVGELLALRWDTSAFHDPDDFVFSDDEGQGFAYNKVARVFHSAVDRAGLASDERLSLHCLRHGFASLSLLIAAGLDVVFVSRQLGHSTPKVTLSIYAHLFA
jgi:integrase